VLISVRKAFLVFLAFYGLASAQDFAWREKDGTAVPDDEHRKAKNGFGAMVLLTEDEGFFERWNTPDPPHLDRLTKATRGVPVHVVVIFAGPGRNENGKANVTYDAKVLSPDGSTYCEFNNLEALKGAGAPDQFLQIPPQSVAIRIEPEDPAGTYHVVIAIHDNVRKVELKLTEKFEVKK
jgi:hypothetical protein